MDVCRLPLFRRSTLLNVVLQYLVVIITSVVLIPAVLVVPETPAPVILTKKARMLRRKMGRWARHNRHKMNDFSISIFLGMNRVRVY
jgi:DHA1 family multidrug resistance protein-like MFS transporter